MAEGAHALAERGHQLDIVLPESGPLEARLSHVGHSLSVRPYCRWATRTPPPWPTRLRQLAGNLRAAYGVARLVRSTKSDVLVTNTVTIPVGAMAAWLSRCPHVWYFHEFGRLDHGLAFHFGERLHYGAAAHFSRMVLVNSEAVASYCRRFIPEHMLRVVPYGVPVGPPPSPTRAPHEFCLVLVGERSPAKGQIEAVRATARLAACGVDVGLDLVGGGDSAYEATLRQAIDHLKLADRVRFVGFQQNPAAHLAGADAVLMCSRSEAFGRVTVEAMKLGKPVVGARAGATPELIGDDKRGLLYAPGDDEDLARALLKLWSDRMLRAKLGLEASVWATAHFSQERFGRELEMALAECVDPEGSEPWPS